MNDAISTADMLHTYKHDDIHGLYRMSSDLQMYFDEMIEGERTNDLVRIESYHEFALALAEALVVRIKTYSAPKTSHIGKIEKLLHELTAHVERRGDESKSAWAIMDTTDDEDERNAHYETAIDAQLEYNKAKSMQAWVVAALA